MWRYVVFAIWFAGTACLGAQLAGLHWVPLPRANGAFDLSLRPGPGGQWTLTHILAVDCPCSKRVAEHLLSRRSLGQDVEQVWLLGTEPDLQRSLAARGFHVAVVDPERLAADSGIQGGPWLVIRDPAGKVAYSGGYAKQRIHVPAEARDLELLSELRQGRHPEAWPAFGCAASHSLRKKLDPLGLKY